MRLTETQRAAIRTAVAENLGPGSGIWLFGSRTDDAKRGGDIDLLIIPELIIPREQFFARKIQLLARLERLLGERKIDMLIEIPDDPRPIVRIAHATGIKL